MAIFFQYFFGILMFFTAVILILVVLVQRGRGGGLAGAFGGAGGQSAFGTKAGDLFTKITIGIATFWILLCVSALLVLNQPQNEFEDPAGSLGAMGTSAGANDESPNAPGETGDNSSSDEAGSNAADGGDES